MNSHAAAIKITKTQDFNFGAFVSGATSGTITINPSTGLCTKTGGVILLVPSKPCQAAVFMVTGDANRTYTITLPANTSKTLAKGSVTMTLDFASTPTAGILSSGGAETLKVGATLHVGGNQATGVYTNSSALSVKVKY